MRFVVEINLVDAKVAYPQADGEREADYIHRRLSQEGMSFYRATVNDKSAADSEVITSRIEAGPFKSGNELDRVLAITRLSTHIGKAIQQRTCEVELLKCAQPEEKSCLSLGR